MASPNGSSNNRPVLQTKEPVKDVVRNVIKKSPLKGAAPRINGQIVRTNKKVLNQKRITIAGDDRYNTEYRDTNERSHTQESIPSTKNVQMKTMKEAIDQTLHSRNTSKVSAGSQNDLPEIEIVQASGTPSPRQISFSMNQ